MDNLAIITPMYQRMNEDGEPGIVRTVANLEKLAQDGYNVYLVDDGSTDGSQEWLQTYQRTYPKSKLNIILREENGQKVGAIRDAINDLPTNIDYIVLTDDDTRIVNPDGLVDVVNMLEEQGHSGTALKVVPAKVDKKNYNNCKGVKNKIKYGWAQFLRLLQDVDYSHSRVWAGYTTSEKAGVRSENAKVRCIAGAGGVWNRHVAEEALRSHSGRHNGDDMELSAIIMSMDFGAHSITYTDKVIFETEVPRSYKQLLKQRIRWDLGALETYSKEWRFYLNEFNGWISGMHAGMQDEFGKHRLAHTTAYELSVFAGIPIFMYLAYQSLKNGETDFFKHYAAVDVAYNLMFTSIAAGQKELRSAKQALASIPALVLYRAALTYPGKSIAFSKFVKNGIKNKLEHILILNKKDVSESAKRPSSDVSVSSHTNNFFGTVPIII